MKDQEINRISAALYEAQRDAEHAAQRLKQLHSYHSTMKEQRYARQEALAELADLEGQLAQTQVRHYETVCSGS